MEKYIGKSVYKGTAIGPVNVLKKSESLIKRVHVENVDEELRRLDKAKEKTLQQLARLYDKALKEVGKVNAEIFEVHQIMLEDEDYQDAIHNMICNENVNAEYAVSITGDNFADMFANMDDDYMRARSADVKDISNRLVSNLSGEEQPDWENTEPSIIVADDLTPSETVQMDKNKILAFVLVHGSANSHTAILARMMNIPALIGVPIELESLPNGVNAIVDGQNGIFYLNPDENQIAQAKEAQQKEQEQKKLLRQIYPQSLRSRFCGVKATSCRTAKSCRCLWQTAFLKNWTPPSTQTGKRMVTRVAGTTRPRSALILP